MRLIDADDLFAEFENSTDWYEYHDRNFVAEKILMNAPTIDAVPVVHGEWEIMLDYPGNESVYICSNCEETWVLNYGTPSENNMNYCPRCGAKMDLEDEK